jgi:hypothetical protein
VNIILCEKRVNIENPKMFRLFFILFCELKFFEKTKFFWAPKFDLDNNKKRIEWRFETIMNWF